MDALLLKYPLDLYRQGRLLLAAEWPLWILGVAAGGAALLIIVTLLRAGGLAPWQRVLVGGLQWAVVVLCLLLLWQPSLEISRLRDQVNAVALMLDASASMSYSDGSTTRQAAAARITGHPALARIAARYPLNRFAFGEQLTRVDDQAPVAATESATRLFDSLTEVLGLSRNTPLAAVLVVSDGIDESTQWRPERLARLAEFGVPVHTIAVGRERVPEDVAIAGVLLPPRVVPGSRLRVRVDLAHDAAHDVVLTVSADDEILSVTEHSLPYVQSGPQSRAAGQTSVWVEVALQQPGHHALEFRLAPVPGESNQHNNRLVRMVEVAEYQLRVLYLEGEPRWEYKFLRRALTGDPGIELHSLLRVSPNRFYRQGIADPEQLESGFPAQPEALFAYDVLMIGSIESASLSDAQVDAISQFVRRRGGGLLMLGGRAGLGEGGWGNSALAGALPVELPPPGSGSFQRRKSPVLPPSANRPAALPRLAEDPAAEPSAWADLPALADYQRLGPLKPAATVLLSMRPDRAQLPLLVQQPYGSGQVAVLATSGSWRWQMSLPVEDQRHEQFWRQLIRNLASSAAQRFSLAAEVEGDAIVVRADLRGADFRPLDTAGVTVRATEGSRPPSELVLTPQPGTPGSYVGRLRPQRSDTVFFEASPRPELAASPPRAAVAFAAGRAEFASLRTNRGLLEAISSATGGRHWPADQLDRLPEAVARSDAGVSERQVLSLWDAPILFLMLMGLKATEWLLRRRWTAI